MLDSMKQSRQGMDCICDHRCPHFQLYPRIVSLLRAVNEQHTFNAAKLHSRKFRKETRVSEEALEIASLKVPRLRLAKLQAHEAALQSP